MHEIIGQASVRKPPRQGKLVSVISHQEWLECLDQWGLWDATNALAGHDRRGIAHLIAESQPYAEGWLRQLPVGYGARHKSADFTFNLQRRLGMWVSAALPVFKLLQACGNAYDPFCDRLLGESSTDKSAPHTAVLRVLYDMHQATAPGAVVYGDKEHKDLYRLFNVGSCLDIGERGAAPGGRDMVVELKVWNFLHSINSRPTSGTTFSGATYGFGNSFEQAIRMVLGFKGREGVAAWSHTEGKGRVTAAAGDYHDAIFNKRSLVVLFHMETTGALSPLARKHVRRLKLRANRDDRTEYGNRAFPTAHMPPGRKTPLGPFVSHWTNRLSSAAVTGNARRASSAMEALAAMPPPPAAMRA